MPRGQRYQKQSHHWSWYCPKLSLTGNQLHKRSPQEVHQRWHETSQKETEEQRPERVSFLWWVAEQSRTSLLIWKTTSSWWWTQWFQTYDCSAGLRKRMQSTYDYLRMVWKWKNVNKFGSLDLSFIINWLLLFIYTPGLEQMAFNVLLSSSFIWPWFGVPFFFFLSHVIFYLFLDLEIQF